MIKNVIVMPGPVLFDLRAARAVGRSFGWTVEMADDLSDVTAAQPGRRTTALLFHRDAFASCSWLEAVRILRSALPEVHLVACHGFSEPIDWPALCDAGAFHALGLPLKEDEVRQGFGFIWEAERRRTEIVPATVRARKLSVTQRITSDLPGEFRTRVMASAAS
jgi:hypothetical protein